MESCRSDCVKLKREENGAMRLYRGRDRPEKQNHKERKWIYAEI